MLLNCHTCYSFCYGTFSTEALLDEALRKGYAEFVLTDINNTSANLDFVRMSKKHGIRPVQPGTHGRGHCLL